MKQKLRRFFIALIREAIREELSGRLSESEAKLALIESHFANIAVRVKEKQDEAKKHLPSMGKQWGAVSRKLEEKSGTEG